MTAREAIERAGRHRDYREGLSKYVPRLHPERGAVMAKLASYEDQEHPEPVYVRDHEIDRLLDRIDGLEAERDRARAEALEEAAKLADERAERRRANLKACAFSGLHDVAEVESEAAHAYESIARAIRALSPTPPPQEPGEQEHE